MMTPLLNYPGYSVTEDGRVYSHVSNKYLRPQMGTNGRTGVQLPVNGRYLRREIHVLVCEAFHGPRPNGMWASHLDGDRLNNHKDNLAWETISANHLRKRDHGTDDRGFKNSRAALTPESAQEARALRAQGWTQQAIADRLGVSRPVISRLLSGKRYNA